MLKIFEGGDDIANRDKSSRVSANADGFLGDVKSSTCTSFPEQAIFYYISKIFPDSIHRYADLGFEFDIYIPSLKVAIEYDGSAWHKKAQAMNKDIEKNNFCRDNNISLFRIREYPLELYSTCICYQVKARDYEALENVLLNIFEKLNILKLKRSDLNVKQDFQDIYAQYKDFSTKESASPHLKVGACCLNSYLTSYLNG